MGKGSNVRTRHCPICGRYYRKTNWMTRHGAGRFNWMGSWFQHDAHTLGCLRKFIKGRSRVQPA